VDAVYEVDFHTKSSFYVVHKCPTYCSSEAMFSVHYFTKMSDCASQA